MTTTPEGVRKPVARRVGLSLEEGGGFRHLLTLTVSSDGGLVLVPSMAAPEWTFASHDMQGRVTRELTLKGLARPKLHYHRSGFTSLEMPGVSTGKRVSVDLPSLDVVTRRQVFTFHQRDPSSCPDMSERKGAPNSLKPGDVWAVSHTGWPSSVGVTGILIQQRAAPWLLKSYLPPLEGDGLPAFQMVPGRQMEFILDLRARNLPAFLVLRFAIGPIVQPRAASATLAGLCGHGEWPSAVVSARTSDGNPTLGLMSPEDLPQFPFRRDQRSTDRRHVTRSADGGNASYGEWV